jgi:NTE family protein
MKYALLAIVALLAVTLLTAQSARPRVGLVLSGGAAKGLAHIPLLRTLDSLGITPDFITGTSMGAIIGGLYASGYSGDSLASLAAQLPWKSLLSDGVPLRDVSIEEKHEFGKYVLELPFVGLKPQIPLGLVGGQRLDQVLSRLTYPVRHITDFDQLPIPFRCLASDVIQGKPYVFRSGNLAQAMRASMAIPMFFTPVRLDSMLLVDGMMFSNLPVSYCKDMGADFIIGSDVGGGLFAAHELTSMPMILYQAAILSSSADFELQKTQCNIFVDGFKHVRVGSLDFDQYDAIIAAGQTAVQEAMPQLLALAEALKVYPGPARTPTHQHSHYILRKVNTTGISDANKDMTLGKFGLLSGDTIDFDRIEEGIAAAYGTRLFKKINYAIQRVDYPYADIVLSAEEQESSTGKFALHYDNERGPGLILGFSTRNVLTEGSRLHAKADIAETPRAMVHYYKYLGNRSRYGIAAHGYFERQLQLAFIGNSSVPKFRERYYGAELSMHRTLNRETALSAGMLYEHSGLKPKLNPSDLPALTTKELESYSLDRLSAILRFERNTFDQVYYPATGMKLWAEAKWTMGNRFRGQYRIPETDGSSTQVLLEDPIAPWMRFHLRFEEYWPIRKGVSWNLRGEAGTSLEVGRAGAGNDYFAYGQGDFFQLGGPWRRPRSFVSPFYGLREQEIIAPHYTLLGAGLQYNPIKQLYFKAAFNILGASLADDWWGAGPTTNPTFTRGPVPDGSWFRSGYGLTVAYNSILGPVQLTYAQTLETGQVRMFINLGFTF